MKIVYLHGLLSTLLMVCSCQTSPLVINVVVAGSNDDVILRCNVHSSTNITRWAYLSGPRGTSLMSYQNEKCTFSASGSWLINSKRYSYECNSTVYQVTLHPFTGSWNNHILACRDAVQPGGSGSTWMIKIVEAPVTSVTLKPSKDSVNIKENSTVKLNCTTSTARPAASVYWYRNPNGKWKSVTQITNNITTTSDYNDLSVTTSILHFLPTRKDDNIKIFCTANNSANTSSVRSIQKILLNVLYKADDPYIPQASEYRVIENTSVTLLCSVKGGNPTPILFWRCNHGSQFIQNDISTNGNVTASITWTPFRTHEGNCTCTSTQTGFQDTPTDVSLVVLYPPSKPVFTVNGNWVGNDGHVYIIEGNTTSINCTSDSKPSPAINTWTGPIISDSFDIQALLFYTVKKEDAGQYTCSVHNTMNPSNGSTVAGVNRSTVNVVVLYSPVVSPMDDISKLNGTRLNVVCNFTEGMPGITTIKWTRDIDNREWNNVTLDIEFLEKSDTGIYTCTANNTMKQSGDNKSYIGQHKQSFHFNVQYAASITSFTIDGFTSQTVTVNESDPVRFTCNADSNPTGNMTLSHESKTKKAVTSNIVDYNITKASCQDAGTYYCSVQNMHNDKNGIQNTVQILVNCSPRVGKDVDVNVTSEKNKTTTIVLNVIAYPPPNFTWYQLFGENWNPLHSGDNYIIKSENSQSNLTIRSVGMIDFTSYKVIVENDFGQMEKFYSLSPYDKPDSPTGFRHVEGLATTSSIHIEWEPGFDNGPSQTFYIKYKKSSDTVWNYLNVTDNGEPTMNITLTGLLENTQYDLIIFASNVKGNSTESNVLITRTKAIHNPTPIPGALIGGIAGGVTGCIVIVIVLIFIIRRYPLFKENGADRQKVRRSVSEDSDDEDGLVDNPMYASSSNVAPVASTSASTSTDIYSKPVKSNKTNAAGNGDIYSVVNKTKGQGKGGKGKSTNEKGKQKEGDVYENVELENNPNKKDAGKQLSQTPPAEQPKLKIVNQDGLIYADLVFKDKPPGEKMVILGDNPTPYDLVDFTKKADPLPESDEEEQK